ncbi:Rossmann-fold NAD(P)-binding domain-containing protein, partial [Staphylococcus epidermidis]
NSFLKHYHLTPQQFQRLIHFPITLKKYKQQPTPHPYLHANNIPLLFQNTSTPTPPPFTLPSIHLPPHPQFLPKNHIQLPKKQSLHDTPKLLPTIFHAIQFTPFSQKTLQQFPQFSPLPLSNPLTHHCHPTQMLPHYITIKQNFPYL